MSKKAKVLLLKPLSGKGNAGDVIEVKEHFAHYVLFPEGTAVLYDKQTQNQHEAHKKKIALFNKDLKAAIEKFAEHIKENAVTFTKNASENGALYDSITGKTIAQYAQETHNVTISSEHFTVDPKIEALGEYTAQFQYDSINTPFTILVERA